MMLMLKKIRLLLQDIEILCLWLAWGPKLVWLRNVVKILLLELLLGLRQLVVQALLRGLTRLLARGPSLAVQLLLHELQLQIILELELLNV
jgi:hypothetical protein